VTRLTFHNPDLDSSSAYPGTIVKSDDPEANLVGSLCEDGYHRPALDIDLPCELVKSSTKDHFHLYIDKPLTFNAYRRLIAALVEAEIMDKAHLEHLDRNGSSLLRKPGVKKKKRERNS